MLSILLTLVHFVLITVPEVGPVLYPRKLRLRELGYLPEVAQPVRDSRDRTPVSWLQTPRLVILLPPLSRNRPLVTVGRVAFTMLYVDVLSAKNQGVLPLGVRTLISTLSTVPTVGPGPLKTSPSPKELVIAQIPVPQTHTVCDSAQSPGIYFFLRSLLEATGLAHLFNL